MATHCERHYTPGEFQAPKKTQREKLIAGQTGYAQKRIHPPGEVLHCFGEKDSIRLEDLVLQGNTMLGALLPQLEPTMPEALRRTQQKTPGAMRHQIEQTMPGALWA